MTQTRYAFAFWILIVLLTACNPKSEIRNPKSDAVLPQPTNQPTNHPSNQQTNKPSAIDNTQYAVRNTQSQTIEVRITHVRDLSEILVHSGDQVEAGQVLARLAGHAEELERDVQLIELELAQARAKLTAARQDAVSAHEQQVAEAAAQVTTLEHRVTSLQRQQQIAAARLAEARATTAHRQRWLDILEPLDEFDPWGDLPYLVGSQSGPKGPRSDLAYREAVAKAEYDLRQARLAQQIAELEAAAVDTQLEQTQADLEAARKELESLQATPPSAIQTSSNLAIYEASVGINELRLAQAQAEVEETVVKSLVAGQVLDVRVDRVDGNEATVIIRITAVQN